MFSQQWTGKKYRGKKMAGASKERQESGVIKKIKDAIKQNENNAITLVAGKTIITGVIDAYKYKDRQLTSEPYTDVVLKIKEGNKIKKINLSLKGESAPSLAGGGLKGLELVIPGIAKKFMIEAHDNLLNVQNLNSGDKVPDVYGLIPSKDKLEIVVGNASMGGSIDYMYIGKMDVRAKYNVNDNILTFENGSLIDSETYAKTHDLYSRLRARRKDQRFDSSAKDNKGIPKIYGKSPSKGDSAGKIVVTDSIPMNAVVVKLR